MAGGMMPENIRVLVATGLHRPNEDRELDELIGDDWVLKTVKVENHFARNNEDHADLGLTNRQTPIKIDRRFLEAELRIVTGLVEPHFMAGYSGGRKVIIPGIAHEDTIRRIHTASFLEHPRSANCVLEGNPLHEEMLEAIDLLGGALAVNTVITDRRELSFVNFGEIKQSHLLAVEYTRPFAEVFLPQKYQTIITSSAGYPLDKTYYQTIKGMVGALEVLKRGGDIFMVSQMSEGFGSSEYRQTQKRLIELGEEGFLKELEARKKAAIDEWETEMQLKVTRMGTVRLFTQGLTPDEERLTGVEVFSDLTEFSRAIARSGFSEKQALVIPEGPYILPFLKV
jgi:nickel-dependent lactate racemase